ncbi:MAG: tetratricopeptide repeat protein [Planctomycetota bacterium]|jgi:tetratricopeptide (TPR) repeat protein|nr:tetratricopeptide repeat protein [Planctomycetota bacterium]
MDLSKHLEKAAEAVKRRNYPFAIKLYGQLLGLQPDSGEARAGLRSALFKKAEAKPPSKLFAMIGGGIHLLAASISKIFGKHAAMAKAYERYLSLDPLSQSVNMKLAGALKRAGFKSSALAVYRAFAEHQPRCLEASREAALLLHETGEFDEAMRLYEQVLKIDPRDQESLKGRKNLAAEGALRKTGIETAESSRDLIKDVEEQQRLERSHRLQLSREEIDAEMAGLEEKIAENPEDLRLLVRTAELREMAGDLVGALDCFERATELAPHDSDLADKSGDLRLRQQEGRVRDAHARGDEGAAQRAEKALTEMRLGEYRRRVKHHPTDLGLRFELGATLLSLGEIDAAIAELQQAVKDPRKKVSALHMLGKAFREKGLTDLALGQLEKALEASVGHGEASKDILYDMGGLAEDAGDTDQALDYFSRIIEQDIGYKDVAGKIEQLKSSS